MSDGGDSGPRWWARGLLFENCNCQTVCPGHVRFEQLCTHERCLGYWAIRFDDGELDGVKLGGVRALIAYESPQRMIDGAWTQVIVVDESATPGQRTAVEAILTGQVGGPWAVLARFVSKRLETRFLPIEIEDSGTAKRVEVRDLIESSIQAIRGRDRSKTVTFENMFNQIHAPSQVIATGSTRYEDGVISVQTDGTHALYSEFHWKV